MLALRRAAQPTAMAITPITPSSSTVPPCPPRWATTMAFSPAGSRASTVPLSTLAGAACGRTNAAASVADAYRDCGREDSGHRPDDYARVPGVTGGPVVSGGFQPPFPQHVWRDEPRGGAGTQSRILAPRGIAS